MTKRAARGFTLIELMVTVSVAAVLLAVAAPSFNSVVINNRLSGYANSWVASAQLARSEAIKRNSPVTLCRSANGSTCAASGTWDQGWVVRHATTNTVIQVQQALPDRYDMTGSVYTIDFQSVGAGATVATVKICPTPALSDGAGRDISLSATGRPAISANRTGVCP